MNSYLLTRLFYQQLESCELMQRHCKPQHQALFFRMVEIQNQVGWQIKSIGLPTENTMFYACIGSYKTYKKCVTDLIAWGLVKEIMSSKNQYQALQISLHTEKWTAFFAEASSEQLPEQDQYTAKATTQASSTHCPGTDQSTAKASPAYKTNKLIKEETYKSLNLETSKESDLTKPPDSIEEEISICSEIDFTAKEKLTHNSIEAHSATEEKKKVAPKRKEIYSKLKTKLTKPDLLFGESPYADKTLFVEAFCGSEYETASLEYYHEIIKNWSESKQARKRDWIATAKNWMLKDFKEGKLVTQFSTSYGKPTQPDTASPGSFTGLGDAVDRYFERKFGK